MFQKKKNIFSAVKSKKLKEIFNKDLKELFASKKDKSKTGGQKKTALAVPKSYLLGLVVVFFVFGFALAVFFSTYLPGEMSRVSPAVKDYFTSQERERFGEQGSPPEKVGISENYEPKTSQEEAVIEVVKKASPAVVSIVITKEVPIYEKYYEKQTEDFFNDPFSPFGIEIEIPKYRQKGTEKKKVGGGTGFVVSRDGLILTNKHVVADKEAIFTVIMGDGRKYEAKVLARDPLQDLAILKIDPAQLVNNDGSLSQEPFPVLELGDSNNLQIGQTVITIGNALGEFRNTVSVGVISGLSRNITASGGGVTETLEDVIQTDAAINHGNSGGPLLDLRGKVVGVNVAMAEAAQNIGFSIPIERAQRDIKQVKEQGKISYPFLGIRYLLINPEVQEEMDLPVDFGALIENDGEASVMAGSAAEKAGLKEGDIILRVNNQEITSLNPLSKIIRGFLPGEEIVIELLPKGAEKTVSRTIVLGEISSED